MQNICLFLPNKYLKRGGGAIDRNKKRRRAETDAEVVVPVLSQSRVGLEDSGVKKLDRVVAAVLSARRALHHLPEVPQDRRRGIQEKWYTDSVNEYTRRISS